MQSFFDVVDENDKPMGKVASYDEVNKKGLWHRGAHVIIYSPDKEILMQKRSPSLDYHPDEIEISVGGGVDAGESPEQTIVREVHEELGIDIDATKLRYIGKTKFNHRNKKQLNRSFIYSYAICIPKKDLKLNIDTTETSETFFISEKDLRKALRKHRIKHVGRISSLYAYWKYLLDSM